MGDLKELLLNEGFEDVSSYINSGNLFFTSIQSSENCISKIRNLLENNYDFSIPFALVTKEEYLKERAELPDWWEEELARRDVLFFSCNLDKSEVTDFIDKSEFYNEIVYVGRQAVFWGKYNEKEFLRTSYHKLLMKEKFYPLITIRNGRTFDMLGKMLG